MIAKSFRSCFRACLLFASLLEVRLRFALLHLRHGGRLTLEQRALWLHDACSRIVRRLSMDVTASGKIPESGLVVSNHLSHLDILFYASLMPCVFVSKAEVLRWPMFGPLARCGGTIFVERTRAAGIERTSQQIAEALGHDLPVILFPEGTSTDGGAVLPFFSALFEAAVRSRAAVLPAAIGYSVEDGIEKDLCYYGDITFAPHLLSALGHRGVKAHLAFDEAPRRYTGRKIAAQETWKRVVALREVETEREAAGSAV